MGDRSIGIRITIKMKADIGYINVRIGFEPLAPMFVGPLTHASTAICLSELNT
jgi:hypothetical protein